MKRKKPLLSTSSDVTLGMVAAASGVSPSTVSRVLSGSAQVSAEKSERVRRAIDALGFVPNTIARALADGRTFNVGLLAQVFESPYYALLLRGIEEVLTPAGYGLVVASGHWNPEEERRCVASLRSRRVDGIIVLTGGLTDEFLVELARELPVVVTGRALRAPGLHALKTDDVEGARAATRHLIERGHTRIAFIGGDATHADSSERERGYRLALADAGLEVDEALIAGGDYVEDGGARAMTRMLEAGSRFTAVFAANDQMASGAARVLHGRGFRVPEDISLVGYDDLLNTAHASPPRTTVDVHIAELGRRAASAMLDLLRTGGSAVLPPAPQLIVRESTRRLGAA
ncbi:LacI family DNA-binding transcriptional regulator [Mitsuaria sp. GD03876]|uniref:LacI family DNA-binding transcriptional regulator n=1 Tax=Mitsuaria sp. GD03876 TaxID=2975399 RepID=UPI002446C0CD|nr:LacI family DNA-binding transcriptional regulator [Mitsuaria sp. GD03876]MDH0864533.1 LacI family transcriptional regulator [Mitsuaria sp. GD03876]